MLLESILKAVFLSNLVSYLSLLADKLYTFDSTTTNQVELDQNKKAKGEVIKPILIVGKEYCFESTREIPIGSIKEAINAARLVPNDAPFAGKTYFEVNRIDENRSVVTFCTIRQSVYDDVINQCWMIIPEPLLLKNQLSDELLNHSSIFSVSDTRKLEVKQIGHQFQCKVLTAQDIDSTLPLDTDKAQAHRDYIRCITRAVSELPTYMYWQLFNVDRIKSYVKSVNWKFISGVGLITCSVYMLAVSLWLTWHEAQLNDNIKQQSSELDAVFALQNKLRQTEKNLSFWRNESKLETISSPVWQVFVDMIKNDIELMSFRIEGQAVTLRGKTNKATDAITFLSKLETISTPESTAPVVSSRGKEVFSVKFRLLQVNESE